MPNTPNTNQLTDAIITAQVRQLRDEAGAAGDAITVDLCDIVLSGEDSDGSGTSLGAPCTLEQASRAVSRTIFNARAQVD